MIDSIIEGIPVLVIVAVVGTLYGLAIRRIWRRTSRRVVPPWRAACFALGLALCIAALVGPVDSLADVRFSWHMVQHILLLFVVAPLFAVATPITVLVLSLPTAARRHLTTPILRSRAAKIVLSPQLALAAFVIVIWGSHLPTFYDATLTHQMLHDLEHTLYLVTGTAFWSAIVGLDLGPARLSYPARLLYLFFSMAAMEMLGLALSGGDHALYAYYVHQAHVAGYSALADQHAGGVTMWLCGMLVAVAAMVAVVLAWVNDDERRTRHEEERYDRHFTTVGSETSTNSRNVTPP